MTEQEWLTSTDPTAMLDSLRREWDKGRDYCTVSDRKLRLFAAACCRQAWDQLTDNACCVKCAGSGTWPYEGDGYFVNECPDCSGSGRINRSHRAVEVAERYADGEATVEEMGSAFRLAPADWESQNKYTILDLPWMCCSSLPEEASVSDFFTDRSRDRTLDAKFAAILREIVGNPWRPVKVYSCGGHECGIIDSAVLAIARSIYDTRRFNELPILADALEEAGCKEETILMHLQGQRQCPHVRGCWALDCVLGKE